MLLVGNNSTVTPPIDIYLYQSTDMRFKYKHAVDLCVSKTIIVIREASVDPCGLNLLDFMSLSSSFNARFISHTVQ